MTEAEQLDKRLDAIAGMGFKIGDMRELKNNLDMERAHGSADDLLCEAIQQLADALGDKLPEMAKELIDAYVSIHKWYA